MTSPVTTLVQNCHKVMITITRIHTHIRISTRKWFQVRLESWRAFVVFFSLSKWPYGSGSSNGHSNFNDVSFTNYSKRFLAILPCTAIKWPDCPSCCQSRWGGKRANFTKYSRVVLAYYMWHTFHSFWRLRKCTKGENSLQQER